MEALFSAHKPCWETKSFYKECTSTSLMRGSETRKRVRKEEKGEGCREGRKEGKQREGGGGKGWFKDR